jgi:hypothetical protein
LQLLDNKRLIEPLKLLVLNPFPYHFFNNNVKKIQTPTTDFYPLNFLSFEL